MKNRYFLGAMALLAAGLLASCSKDADLTDFNKSKPLEEDQSFFVNINVMGADALTRSDAFTRAEPNFFTGNEEENKVNSIYLVFYDVEGNRVSTTQVLRDNADDWGTYPDSNTENSKVTEGRNSFYRGIVQIDVKHGSLPPAYVMAFINPITSQNFDINPDFETLDAVSKTTRPMIMSRDGNFAMSKSVYYGKNRVSGEEHVKIVATPLIDEETAKEGNYVQQLFKSKTAAEEAMDSTADDDTLSDYDPDKSSVVNIYVERYAARVNFKLADKFTTSDPKIELNKDKNGEGLAKVTLIFKPEYWAVNAYESDTYIVKSFLNADAVDSDEIDFFDPKNTLSWKDLNNALGATKEQTESYTMPWTWNSETYHRSYWAQSPAYYAQKYPRTADDIEDNGADKYPLGYYSYDKIKDNAKGYLNDKARRLFTDSTNPKADHEMIYARENTVAGSALIAAYNSPVDSPKAAIPSVVLVGHYEIEGKGELSEDKFIYIRGNATNGYFVYNQDEMLRYFVNTTIPFAADDKGDTPIFEYNNQYDPDANGEIGDFTQEGQSFKEYFTIIHPKQAGIDKEDKLVIDSRFVTIQLDKDKFTAAGSGLYASIDGVYEEVTVDNVDKVNNQMLYAAGTVQGFSGGKVYYSIPIQHLGYKRPGNTNNEEGLTANSKDFNWEIVKSGDFGLVRNHVYTIIVDEITGLGNGIPDPSVPIVPPTDPEEYYIGARLIVLNWAMVDEQHETL